MSKLRIGTGAITGAQELQKLQADLKQALDKDDALFRFVDAFERAGGAKLADQGQQIIQAEMRNPRSGIDWTRFQALRDAGPGAFDAARRAFKEAWPLESHVISLNRELSNVRLDTSHDVGWFLPGEARDQYQRRLELLRSVDKVELAANVLASLPGNAPFPKAQIEALKNQLQLDMDDLLRVHGPGVKEPPKRVYDDRLGSYKAPPPKPKFLDPTPAAQLPKRVALTPSEVTDLKDAAKNLERLLKSPGLAAKIEAFANAQGEAEHQLIKVLGTFTLLADEATTAPDYRYVRGASMPDRAHYRARLHTRVSERNEGSRRILLEALGKLLESPQPVADGERAVVEHFLREIGFKPSEVHELQASFETVTQALEEEAFLPLRYLNEYEDGWKYRPVWAQMSALFRQVTSAFVEGRFEEWKSTLPTSERQLRSLTPAGREAWLTPLETQREIKDSKGESVILRTHEARGLERLWVTKNHTGSHGFDHPIGTPCLLAYLTNARTEAIIVEDPRWPQHAGRMYMRLLERPDGKPVMFVEGMAKDNEYPCQSDAEQALLAHAIQKAKAIGAELVISGYAADSVKNMGLKGETKYAFQSRFVLSATPLVEATVAFGDHDWVHKDDLIRTPNRDPFHYAGD